MIKKSYFTFNNKRIDKSITNVSIRSFHKECPMERFIGFDRTKAKEIAALYYGDKNNIKDLYDLYENDYLGFQVKLVDGSFEPKLLLEEALFFVLANKTKLKKLCKSRKSLDDSNCDMFFLLQYPLSLFSYSCHTLTEAALFDYSYSWLGDYTNRTAFIYSHMYGVYKNLTLI